MKKTVTSIISIAISVLMIVCLVSCANNSTDKTGLWENAKYVSDEEFGEGKITVQVEVKAEEQSVTFTVNTDEKYLGDALVGHELIDGEEGQYGLYVKSVNGIVADYDVDQSYWAFYKN